MWSRPQVRRCTQTKCSDEGHGLGQDTGMRRLTLRLPRLLQRGISECFSMKGFWPAYSLFRCLHSLLHSCHAPSQDWRRGRTPERCRCGLCYPWCQYASLRVNNQGQMAKMTMWGLADLLINTHKPCRADAWLLSMHLSRRVNDAQFQRKRCTPTAHITRSNLL